MKKITFTLSNTRTLYIAYFDARCTGSGGTTSQAINNATTSKEIDELIYEMNKKEIARPEQHNYRRIYYKYWVCDYEIMTDNRSDYGHSNQSSSRKIKESITETYVRGRLLTIKEALDLTGGKSKDGFYDGSLYSVASDMNIELNGISQKDLKSTIIMIPGYQKRKDFFEEFKENFSLSTFDKELTY